MEFNTKTIEKLFCAAIHWAKNPRDGVLYTCSRDGGFISLRVDNFKYQELHYRRINIMNVAVPAKKRGYGLYSHFISSLDELNSYGIRWHDTAENEYLAKRHSKRSYFKDGSSFFKVTGAPYPQETQIKMNMGAEQASQKLIAGLAKTQRLCIRRKQKNA